MANWLDPADIERLASDPVRRMRMPAVDQIDLGKPFLPEEYTQLYYTPVYQSLHREHRLRYNQLFGVRINEQYLPPSRILELIATIDRDERGTG